MTCPDVGELRAWLDAESAPATAAHVPGCLSCRRTVDALRADATLAAAAVARLDPPAGISGPADHRHHRRGLRLATGAAAAAVLLLGSLATPVGRSAAASFLAAFRTERISVVEIDPAQVTGSLADLSALGSVESDLEQTEPQPVASVAEASARVGFPVAAPDPGTLPDGLGAEPQVMATPAGTFRLRLDAARTRAYLAKAGADRPLPAGYDGTTLVVNVPAAALLTYSGRSVPVGLVVGQSGSLTADTEGGLSLDRLRAFLLELPGLPARTVRQLQAISDWRSTLPLPVPVDRLDWDQATISGAPGVVLKERSGLGSAALWQRDGRIFGVAGTYDTEVVRRVAESLRP